VYTTDMIETFKVCQIHIKLLAIISVANEIACSTFKYLVSIYLSSAVRFQKPSTVPSSTSIDLLWVVYMLL